MSAIVSSTLSASTCATSMVTPVRAFTDSATFSQLTMRRLASVIWLNMSLFIAILWTATEPTPPAPMTRTLLNIVSLTQARDAARKRPYRSRR